MHYSFANPQQLTAEFWQLLLFWALLVYAGAALLWVAERRRPNPISLLAALAIGSLIYVVIALAAYTGTVGNFALLRLEPDALYLEYPAPIKRTVRIPKDKVKTVLFGLPGKRAAPTVACYIKVEVESDTSYRSAAFSTTLDSCKALRAALAAGLGRP